MHIILWIAVGAAIALLIQRLLTGSSPSFARTRGLVTKRSRSRGVKVIGKPIPLRGPMTLISGDSSSSGEATQLDSGPVVLTYSTPTPTPQSPSTSGKTRVGVSGAVSPSQREVSDFYKKIGTPIQKPVKLDENRGRRSRKR